MSLSSAKPEDSQARPQDSLQTVLQHELHHALWKSSNPFEKVFASDFNRSDAAAIVRHLLGPASPHTNVAVQQYLSTTCRFPERGGEREYYRPFCTLVLAIRDAGRLFHLFPAHGVFASLQWEPYDREMRDSPDNDHPIKPDILAFQGRPDSSPKTSWTEVGVCVEVKSDLRPLAIQGTTYARAHFAHQRNRRWLPMIWFTHPNMRVSFALYTAAWVCHTDLPISLTTVDGFAEFVYHIGRLFACTDPWEAGFSHNINNHACDLGDIWGYYNIAKSLCVRHSVRGRRTRVDVLLPAAPPPDLHTLHTVPPALFPIPHPTSNPLSQPRGSLILKDSWPLKGRDQEGDVFPTAANYFGLPEIAGTYAVKKPDPSPPLGGTAQPILDDTTLLQPSDMAPSDIMGSHDSAPPPDRPESRIHTFLLIKTQGERLTAASSLRHMTLAVMHATLGMTVYAAVNIDC
jgi:hypothetical protein